MRHLAALLLVLALAGTGAACGDDTESVGTDSTTTTIDPDAPVESPPLDGTLPGGEGDAELVEPRPGMADVGPQAFESAGSLGDGRVLAVRYTSGVAPCYVLDSVKIEESETDVVVTLMIGHDPDQRDVACIEIAQLYDTRVELDAPIGDRVVVDGAR